MSLMSIHAFLVIPQKGADPLVPPLGGLVSITPGLRQTLKDVYKDANFDNQTSVLFEFSDDRKNVFRSMVMGYLWGDEASSSIGVATRLSSTMDRRTDECLLVLTKTQSEGGNRQLVIWVFPKEEALQFRSGAQNSINVLEDVFSKTSRLRKAARFSGVNTDTSILGGNILDFQNSGENVADYWINDFLSSKQALNDAVGSRSIGEVLESMYNKVSERSSRERIYAAIVTLNNRPRISTKASDLAQQFFGGDENLLRRFKRAFKSDEIYNSRFKFDKQAFHEVVKVSIYTLENGIIVSSPIGLVGDDIVIQQVAGQRRIQASGIIESERVK